MKVAVSASQPALTSPVDPRFGRAPCFVVFDTTTGASQVHDNAINLAAAHGAGIQAAKTVVDAGAQALITGAVGPKAFAALQAGSVQVYQAQGCTVTQALQALAAGQLTQLREPSH